MTKRSARLIDKSRAGRRREQVTTANRLGFKTTALWPGAIFVVAVLIQLIYLHQIESIPLFYHLAGDGRTYDEWAQPIAAGGSMILMNAIGSSANLIGSIFAAGSLLALPVRRVRFPRRWRGGLAVADRIVLGRSTIRFNVWKELNFAVETPRSLGYEKRLLAASGLDSNEPKGS